MAHDEDSADSRRRDNLNTKENAPMYHPPTEDQEVKNLSFREKIRAGIIHGVDQGGFNDFGQKFFD